LVVVGKGEKTKNMNEKLRHKCLNCDMTAAKTQKINWQNKSKSRGLRWGHLGTILALKELEAKASS